jgi:hypothetical protein
VVELEAAGRVHREHGDGARPRLADRLLLAEAGVGDGGDVRGELPRRRRRRPPGVAGRQLAELREVDEPLDDVGPRREELLPPEAETVDQPVDEEVGPGVVERPRG